MTYHIGQQYEIGAGQGYMIGQPQYMIGQPITPFQQQAMQNQQPRAWSPPGGWQPSNMQVIQVGPPPTFVSRSDPTEARLQHLGCNQEVPILVGAVGTAQVQPQKVFKAERYIVPDTVAPDFMLDSITVGVQLQSPANASIPAQAFLPTSIYSNVDFDTCQISQQIVVRPRNIGGADRPYFSSFVGKVLQ